MIAPFDFQPLGVDQSGDTPPQGPTVFVPVLPLRVIATEPRLRVVLRRVA